MLLATAARRVLTVAWLYPALQRGRYSTVTPVASGPGKPPPPRRPSSSAGALAEAFASLDGDIGPSGSSASGDASRLKVNAQTKTISTAVGDLPISPVMDADFYSARARWRGMKRRPATVRDKKVAGRFRRVLAKNPFGMRVSCSTP